MTSRSIASSCSRVVSSVDHSVSHNAAASTIIAALPVAAAKTMGCQHQTKVYLKDLDCFNTALAHPLAMAWQSIGKSDQDLRVAMRTTTLRAKELVEQAEEAVVALSATACRIYVTLLPSLKGAVLNSDVASVSINISDSEQALGEVKKKMNTVRGEYVELLKYVRYMSQCTEVSLDLIAITEMTQLGLGEQVEEEQEENEEPRENKPEKDKLNIEVVETRVEQQLKATLKNLDDLITVLSDCSDFWLMLHNAELTLESMERDARRLRKQIGTGLTLTDSLPAPTVEFVNRLKHFCKEHHSSSKADITRHHGTLA